MTSSHFGISAFMLLSPVLSSGQTIFQKTLGGATNDLAYCVIQTSDGSVVFAGATVDPNTFNKNMYLVKMTIDGDLIWTRNIGDSGFLSETANSVAETSDGGFILCGTGPPNEGAANNIMLVKTNSIGQVSWAKSFGGPDADMGMAASQAADGGFIVLGRFDDIFSHEDILVIKTDANGNTSWTKVLSAGINVYDNATSIQQTSDGGYVVTGGGTDAGTFYGLYLIKLDPAGSVVWAKMFHGPHIGYSVRQTMDDGYIVLGTTSTTNYDLYLIKTNSMGDTLWTRSYGGPEHEDARSVIETTDGGFFIAGGSRSFTAGLSDAYLVKTDASGGLMWSRSYGGTNYDLALSGIQTADDGYFAVGQTGSFGSGQLDVYLIRTDAEGNSGCHETLASPVVSSFPVTVSNLVLLSNPGIPVQSLSLSSAPWGTMTTLCLTTGLNEAETEDPFLLFPNPSYGQFTIRTSSLVGVERFEITDMQGKTVQRGKLSNASEQVVVAEGLDPGAYIIQIIAGDRMYHRTLVVAH